MDPPVELVQPASLEEVVRVLSEIIKNAPVLAGDRTPQVPLSNVKRFFRSVYSLDLNEGAFGYSKLSQLLMNPCFHDVCDVRLQGQQWMVVGAAESQSNVCTTPSPGHGGTGSGCAKFSLPKTPRHMDSAEEDASPASKSDVSAMTMVPPTPLKSPGEPDSATKRSWGSTGQRFSFGIDSQPLASGVVRGQEQQSVVAREIEPETDVVATPSLGDNGSGGYIKQPKPPTTPRHLMLVATPTRRRLTFSRDTPLLSPILHEGQEKQWMLAADPHHNADAKISLANGGAGSDLQKSSPPTTPCHLTPETTPLPSPGEPDSATRRSWGTGVQQLSFSMDTPLQSLEVPRSPTTRPRVDGPFPQLFLERLLSPRPVRVVRLASLL